MFFVSMRKKKDNILPVLVENNMCHWDFFLLFFLWKVLVTLMHLTCTSAYR